MTEPKKIHPVQPTQPQGSLPAASGATDGSDGGAYSHVTAMVTRATTDPDYSIEKTEIFAMTENHMHEKHSVLKDHERAIQEKGGVLFTRLNAERKALLTND